VNTEQFHTVWIPLQERFYRMAFYMLEDDAEAKDAVQELYLKLWNLRDHLDLIREPSAYGSLLLKNLCIDRIRRLKPAVELREDMISAPSADAELGRKESFRAISEAMEQLPPGQRKILRLRVLRGLSYSEIASLTGLSGLNIRVQVSLARKKLKQLL